MKHQALFFHGNDQGFALGFSLCLLAIIVFLYFPFASLINSKLELEKEKLNHLVIKIAEENARYEKYFEDFCNENP